MSIRFPYTLFVAVLLSALAAMPSGSVTPALGQDKGDLSALVDAARKSGARVIIVDPTETQAAEAAKPPNGTEALLAARKEFVRIAAAMPDAPAKIAATLNSQGGGRGAGWAVVAALFGIAFLIVGYIVERLFLRWGHSHFIGYFGETAQNRAERIGYLIVRTVLMLIGVAIMAGVALILAAVSTAGHEASWVTQRVLIAHVFLVRAILAFIFNLVAPDSAKHRALALTDADARSVYRGSVLVFVAIGTLVGFCKWMKLLGLDPDAYKLALIFGLLVSAAALIVLAFANRKAIAGAFVSGTPAAELSMTGRLVSSNWHVLFLLYIAIATAVSILRLLLDQPSALGLVTLPLLVAIGGIGLYGLGLVMIDRYFDRNGLRKIEPEPEEVPDLANADFRRKPSAAFQPLAEYGLALAVTILSVVIIAGLWGLQETEIGGRAARFINIGIIIFVAYLAWKAVKVAIDIKLAEETPHSHDHDSDEIVGTGVSRIATLLPLFRSMLFVTILTMTVMIVLSELGVNIVPLIAGAGVVGLAIGFGAQTLVRDILSGAFFLIDDAFRRGEYIDIGSVKGAVERISIRSMQLRHHRGPLNTVPFGEIQTLTNYSRDWVIMKLPFRVTYDTDVEKVRKLIKKLGQELLDDPELGPRFLDPVKSQGVYQMEDSAIIIRVKFKTRPGDQFEVRKVVYARIREMFAEEGIHFAHREVTVHVADHEEKLSSAEKQAIAGAVLPLLDRPGGEAARQD